MDGLYENPKIKISNRGRLNFDLVLYHTVNILITPESGSGKTAFASCLTTIEDDLPINMIYFNSTMSSSEFESIGLQDKENYLVIVDDNARLIRSGAFKDSIRRCKKTTFLFILRKFFAGVDCFCEAVYNLTMKKERINEEDVMSFQIVQYYSLLRSGRCCSKNAVCIVEGENKKADSLFYSNVYKNVLSANGKKNVVPLIESLSGSQIILKIDSCAFGCEFLELYSLLGKGRSIGTEVYMTDMYSFEYFLLRCLFPEEIKKLEGLSCDYINGLTFEAYIKKVLYEKWYIKGYITKSKLNDCILRDCSDCKYPVSDKVVGTKKLQENRDKCVFLKSLESLSDKYLSLFSIKIEG